MKKSSLSLRKKFAGFSMIEVLVTMVILVIGLLALVKLQSQALNTQMEAYQRTHALVLLQDMKDRLTANRANSSAYVTTGDPLGTGPTGATTVVTCTAPATASAVAAYDLCQWHNALLGAAEKSGTSNTGAMIGARGCIYETKSTTPREYLIAVAWQGMSATKAPDIDCGKDKYGTDDALRRVVSTTITIAKLD